LRWRREQRCSDLSPESLHQLFKQRYQLHGLISEQGQKLFPRRGIGATGAFAQMGIPTDEEIKEHLAVDSQVLKLPEAVSPSQIFDFSLQREVNRELGIR
jgi:hypothetical protein